MRKRILIVDDDPLIRGLLKVILEEATFEVVQAEDGLIAASFLDAEPRPLDFCLLILDVVMPNMNGLELLTRLRSQSHTKDIPVLFLTGEEKADDIMARYSVGADYYITKPFTRQQLLHGIKLILEK
ncbi:MAG: response regulator [Bdellovibrionota bacterium]|jgi:DNA-binding response OmpR family regulator